MKKKKKKSMFYRKKLPQPPPLFIYLFIQIQSLKQYQVQITSRLNGSEKFSKEILKEILPSKPRKVQEIDEQEPASPCTLDTPSVVEDSVDISTSLDSKTHEEK